MASSVGELGDCNTGICSDAETEPAQCSNAPDVEDPVEECLDTEAFKLPPNPQTPPGVAGRFSAFLGVQRSEGSRLLPEQLPISADAELDDEHVSQFPNSIFADAENSNSGYKACACTVSANLKTPTQLGSSSMFLEGDPKLDTSELETQPADLSNYVIRKDDGTMIIESAEVQDIQVEMNVIPQIPESHKWTHPNDNQNAGQNHSDKQCASGGECSDDSDLEQPDANVLGINLGEAHAQSALRDEQWINYPAAERELWERVRTRALRREAAQITALRLPAASLSRLMKLSASLHMRSAESLEIINYATVLLLLAVTRAAARARAPGQRIQFQDIRQTCLTARELSFLLPVTATLDASALALRFQAPNLHGAGGSNLESARTTGSSCANGGANNPRKVNQAKPGTQIAGQRMLSTASFVQSAQGSGKKEQSPSAERQDDRSAGELTPSRHVAAGKKRKAPSSATKTTSKVQRTGVDKKANKVQASAGTNLLQYIRRGADSN